MMELYKLYYVRFWVTYHAYFSEVTELAHEVLYAKDEKQVRKYIGRWYSLAGEDDDFEVIQVLEAAPLRTKAGFANKRTKYHWFHKLGVKPHKPLIVGVD